MYGVLTHTVTTHTYVNDLFARQSGALKRNNACDSVT